MLIENWIPLLKDFLKRSVLVLECLGFFLDEWQASLHDSKIIIEI
jgi:hypothetical protein